MIINRQRRVRVSIPELEKFLARVGRRLRIGARALTVCLVTDAEIARWNRAYRGKAGPTDVLSFPMDRSERTRGRQNARRWLRREDFAAFPRPSAPYLGDIAIAPAVARRNARRFGRTFEEEMRILILHGILHLMGYDHETDEGQMDRREQQLRRALKLS
ncbi:MAG TPA: rRNA maturation RNase YbeY [Candidatus Sulfotelmatobacter sp.]|nr:rRNA maturation RNase YbeY [Candidatus Sulfotelmatobacter sp.]